MKNLVVLLIIAGEHYQPLEYNPVKEKLEQAGYKVITASNRTPIALGSDGQITGVDLIIDQINIDNYDGIFLIGGRGAHGQLDNDQIYELMRKADKSSKIKAYGAICYSTRILAHAGLLKGRRATGWDGDNMLTTILDEAEANYIKEPVCIDGRLITAQGPAIASQFADTIVHVINEAVNRKAASSF